MHYYGTRLSENISRREPEGYLLCLNVPVARTGTQEYLPEELGLPPPDKSGPAEAPQYILVYRPPEEVFSPEAIASFEAMPVTNDHPPDGVDISNIRALQKGHVHNVRRGSGEESDLLLADLIITDPVLIDLIMDGKREISCGYTYELREENGQYIQRKIRGNHVAVVDAGRAGHRVSIKDHQPERRTQNMKKSLSRILARMAKDGDVETVAEFIEELIEPEAAETPAETIAEAVAEIAPVAGAVVAAAEPEAVIETPEATIVVDEATLEGIISRLDQIITLLTPAVTDDDPVEEIVEVVEEVLEAQTAVAEETQPTEDEDLPEGLTTEEIAGIVSGILDPATEATSEVLDPQEDECDPDEQEVLSTGDALRKALRPSRAKLARMSRKERTRVMDRIASCLMVSRRSNVADTKVGKLTAEKRRSEKATELGNRIMATRNANCRK